MRTLGVLIRKEFKQIFRNKAILALTLMMPIMQFLILPLAANFEFKNINLAIVDNDRSALSAGLISQITGSGYFRLIAYGSSYEKSYSLVETDKVDLILEIPNNFERALLRENSQQVFVAVNAINGTKAVVGGNYLNGIIADFNKDVILKFSPDINLNTGLEITSSTWFNPKLNYKISLIPGILALLVTIVGGFLAALNIVKEKEVGTIEQINVTPIRKRDFILGKMIPFWILGNVVFTVGLILGYFVYDIVPQGSLLVLYAFIGVYLLAVLGFGLLVSTISNTQQEVMFIQFFFIMIFILMGGLFTSVDSMPDWAQVITQFNPVRYMIKVMQMVMLKGSGFAEIRMDLAIVALMAVVLNTAAIINYRKTS
jgi:ABC-2 type transport system permease protein